MRTYVLWLWLWRWAIPAPPGVNLEPPGAHLAQTLPGTPGAEAHLAHLARSSPGAHLARMPTWRLTWRKPHLAVTWRWAHLAHLAGGSTWWGH